MDSSIRSRPTIINLPVRQGPHAQRGPVAPTVESLCAAPRRGRGERAGWVVGPRSPDSPWDCCRECCAQVDRCRGSRKGRRDVAPRRWAQRESQSTRAAPRRCRKRGGRVTGVHRKNWPRAGGRRRRWGRRRSRWNRRHRLWDKRETQLRQGSGRRGTKAVVQRRNEWYWSTRWWQ